MDRDYSEIISMFNFDDIIDTELLGEITDNALKLADSMKKLRDKYKAAGELPLSPFHDEYENMMTIVSIIEGQAIMFGEPMKIYTNYNPYTSKEIKEIKNNPMYLIDSGLDEWVEEGLI